MSLFDRRESLKKELDALTEQIAELKGEIKKLTIEKNATSEVLTLTEKVKGLKTQVSDLEIQKAQKEEAFARRERELTHMVGLEHSRQEQELKLGKRESEVSVREANLKSEREEFEKRMKFREETFDAQTKRFDELLSQILKRLPTVTIDREIAETRKR